MGLKRILHARQHRLGMPFRGHFGNDLDVRMALDPVLESPVALLAIEMAQRSLEIDDGSRLVADQRHKPRSGVLAVREGVGAEVSVHRARVGWRLVNGHERNIGGVGALDVLENGLIIPRYGNDAGDFLSNARVDLGGLPLGVLSGRLLDQIERRARPPPFSKASAVLRGRR